MRLSYVTIIVVVPRSAPSRFSIRTTIALLSLSVAAVRSSANTILGLRQSSVPIDALVEPESLKTGEVWLRCDVKRRRTWIVVDAFSGPKTSPKSDRSDTATFLNTFPMYGIRDEILYLSWLRQHLRTDKPTLMAPCRGAIVAASDLPAQLLALAELHL